MFKKFGKTFINIVLLIISFYLLLNVFTTHFFNEKETTVPNLINLEQEQAISLLNKKRLNYKIVNGKASSFKQNFVFSQYPKAHSKVKVNRVIQIWVNNSENIQFLI